MSQTMLFPVAGVYFSSANWIDSDLCLILSPNVNQDFILFVA